jgi:predicted anti-sigma-YlaC factor YlaD
VTDHERFREAIYGDELVPGLGEHLAGCEECRALVAKLERIDRVNREAPITEPRPTLAADILAAMGVSQTAERTDPRRQSR